MILVCFSLNNSAGYAFEPVRRIPWVEGSLKTRPEDKKSSSSASEAVRASLQNGQLRSIESEIFREEGLFSDGSRHLVFYRRLCERMQDVFHFVEYEGICLIWEQESIRQNLRRISFPGKSKKESTALRAKLLSIPTQSPRSRHLVCSYLAEHCLLHVIFGWRESGFTCHYVQDLPRFKHAVGLTSAVDCAMSSLEFNVTFPAKMTRKLVPGTAAFDKLPFRRRLYMNTHSMGTERPFYRYICNRRTTRSRPYHLLCHYLRVFPKGKPEKFFVKLIKTSLAWNFSKAAGQELPVGSTIPLFPSCTQERIDRALCGESKKKERVRFWFNLLQSKSLCWPVGEDMVEEAYDKHQSSLCHPDPFEPEPEILQEIEEYASQYARRLSELYDPGVTKYPNTRACLEASRHKGGVLAALKSKGALKSYTGNPILQLEEGPRFEPFVIGLFGEPATGKTLLVQKLISLLGKSLFPGLSRGELSYSRSCSTKHWDGYTNQPIAVLDDFGQNLSDREDLVEFENLISVNEYVVPMADLPSKGRKFNSPIVIVTSNMQFGSNPTSAGQETVEDPYALWRRFHLPLLLTRGDNPQGPIRAFKYELRRPTQLQTAWSRKFGARVPATSGTCSVEGCRLPASFLASNTAKNRSFLTENLLVDATIISASPEIVCAEIVDELSRRWDFHRRELVQVWSQTIAKDRIIVQPSFSPRSRVEVEVGSVEHPIDDRDSTLSVDFPAAPPARPPVVQAVALSEPLKVRMITTGEVDCKCLQPLQIAMWRLLTEFPQFCLVQGAKAPWSEHDNFQDDTLPWIHRIEKRIQSILALPFGTEWLSGDYTSATDHFPLKVSQALLKGLLKNIDHGPTRRWAEWEMSPHTIRYPKGSGRQTSGQLMGGLLSFPLLCLLNDFLAQKAGFRPCQYLINGDDFVARGTDTQIEKWWSVVPKVGLSLSVGKNFRDPDFCTINSQLFYQGDVVHTGKASCFVRYGQTLSYTFSEVQFYWGSHDYVLYEYLWRNQKALRQTPRSLRVPTKCGGLGYEDTTTAKRFDHGLAKRVYFHDLFNKMRCHRISKTSFWLVPIPTVVGTQNFETFTQGTKEVDKLRKHIPSMSEEKDISDLTHSDLFKFFSGLEKELPHVARSIDNLCKDGKFQIRNFPSLPKQNGFGSSDSFFRIEWVIVKGEYRRQVFHTALEQALVLWKKLFTCQSPHPLDWDGGGGPTGVLAPDEQGFLEILQQPELLWCSEPDAFLSNDLMQEESSFPLSSVIRGDQEDIPLTDPTLHRSLVESTALSADSFILENDSLLLEQMKIPAFEPHQWSVPVRDILLLLSEEEGLSEVLQDEQVLSRPPSPAPSMGSESGNDGQSLASRKAS